MFVLKSKYRKLEQERDEIARTLGSVAIERDSLKGKVLRLESDISFLTNLNIENLKTKNKLPMLTKTEAEWFHLVLMEFAGYNCSFQRIGLTSNDIRVLRSLIKKGYLVKPKRGEYRLSFVRYESDSV